jgi:hypothetical protein
VELCVSDPFASIAPIAGRAPTVIVHEQKQNQTFAAWRQAHIAMPDLHVIDRKQPLPEPIADDGKPLTRERIQELMGDVRPMFEPSPDGDNRKAKPTNQIYTKVFDDRLSPERIGQSAESRRPAMRVVPPVEADLEDCVRADKLALSPEEGTVTPCQS